MIEASNERLIMFSDAVIAITITLLVIDLRLPHEVAVLTDAELKHALVEIWPHILGYLISFGVIGAFWFSHNQKFSVIVGTARGLMALNMVFLCCIGIIPFVSALLTENPGILATQIYAATMLACALMLGTIWLFAILKDLVSHSVSRREQWRGLVLSVLAIAIFALSIPLAALNPELAKLSWLLLLPLSMIKQY